ncbi:spore germination protein [Paenibacillus thiaminolyticus]|uniref:spore germination protein n=1 Tax=Paenibacillus thiaminolyticus TaxID=49283 RepID=UPI00232D5DB3|nr:spore germination protein [Paenibacillus thiaminolyticus]WCF08810.1 spore germination protein [Paenibacillus thiaminolyticus]
MGANSSSPTPLTLKVIHDYFAECSDIKSENYEFGSAERTFQITLIYCSGLTDMKQLNQAVVPALHRMLQETSSVSQAVSRNRLIPLLPLPPGAGLIEMERKLFAGELLVYVHGDNEVYFIDICERPERQPEESNTEVSIKGPKDGFTENLATNVALVRKRLRTQSVNYETFIIGRRSQTEVGLLYMQDVIRPHLVDTVRKQLYSIDTDIIVGSSQLGELMLNSNYSMFPLMDYIGRPDYVVESLSRGRFVILVDGSPMALIGPSSLWLLLKSPEDIHFPVFFVVLQRIIRLSGLIISLFTPGFWLALTAYNVEQLPFPLLATVSNTRTGLPLSATMELLFMLGMFELFREAGIRLPKAVGQTLAVVGGLIVGDASIRAGLASPTTLVVAAVTAVATFTLINQSLSGTVSVLRLGVLLASSLLGMFGFFLAVMTILLYLSSIMSYGIPYLAPVSPPQWRDMWKALLRVPLNMDKYRPSYLTREQDNTRKGDDS